MELEMETKTATTKPNPSSLEEETSPLMKANTSASTISQAEATIDATGLLSRECLFKYFCTFLLSLLFFSAIFIFSLPFIIKIPDFKPTFDVDSLSVSSLNVSDCQISSNWNISFLVKNRRQPMFYDAIRVLVLYQNEFCLSIGNVESFYQRSGEESVVQAWLGGSSVNLKKWVVSAIKSDISTREMDIFVVLEAIVTANPGSSKYRNTSSVKVSCKDLKVELSSDDSTAGSMSSGNSSSCQLKYEDEA